MFLKLFLTFLEIGAVSFGGGYGMISLIREKVLLNGWLSEAEFLSFIAVSESTPGPLAVNMATLILSTAFTMGLSTLLGISTAAETPSPAWRGIGILAILAGVRLIWQKARGKAPSPIGMILFSAVLGALLYQ